MSTLCVIKFSLDNIAVLLLLRQLSHCRRKIANEIPCYIDITVIDQRVREPIDTPNWKTNAIKNSS